MALSQCILNDKLPEKKSASHLTIRKCFVNVVATSVYRSVYVYIGLS